MKVDIIASTGGKGKFTEEVRAVMISRLDIGYSNQKFFPGDPWNGEVRAYFDPFGFTIGSWNVPAYGHICGDRQWLKEFKSALRNLGFSIKASQCIKYNDILLQKDNYVSLEAGPAFWASWQRLQQKIEEGDVEDVGLEA